MVHPLGNRLLIEPAKTEEVKSAGGILLQDDPNKHVAVRGTVVLVGAGCDMSWQPGVTVLYPASAATEAKHLPTDTNVILSEDDVIGVIVPDPAE